MRHFFFILIPIICSTVATAAQPDSCPPARSGFQLLSSREKALGVPHPGTTIGVKLNYDSATKKYSCAEVVPGHVIILKPGTDFEIAVINLGTVGFRAKVEYLRDKGKNSCKLNAPGDPDECIKPSDYFGNNGPFTGFQELPNFLSKVTFPGTVKGSIGKGRRMVYDLVVVAPDGMEFLVEPDLVIEKP